MVAKKRKAASDEVTIRYTRKVAGHPEPGSQVTVERTAIVEALLEQGYAVEVTSDEDGKQEVEPDGLNS